MSRRRRPLLLVGPFLAAGCAEEHRPLRHGVTDGSDTTCVVTTVPAERVEVSGGGTYAFERMLGDSAGPVVQLSDACGLGDLPTGTKHMIVTPGAPSDTHP